MKDVWKVEYQLVLPNIHRRNAAKCSIFKFKAHFLAILLDISKDFPQNLWDILIPQTEITLDLLRQSKLKPATSAWGNFNGPSSYNHAPLGCKVIMHNKTSAPHSWDLRRNCGWNVGVSHEHYCCQLIVAKDTKAVRVSDTI